MSFADIVADQRQKLLISPYDYNTRLELINTLSNINENHPDLENEFEAFHQLYPLGENLWKMWIDYETRIDGDVFQTFQKSKKDFCSLMLWKEFAKFILQSFARESPCCSVDQAREIFEEGLGMISRLLDPQVSEFWTIYRSWEEQFGNTDHGISEKCIDGLYHRQLKLPNCSIESTISEYALLKSNTTETNSSNLLQELKQKYQDQISESLKRLPFEESLQNTRHDLTSFLNYIEWEKNRQNYNGFIFRIKSLYEHALNYHNFDSNLWIDYVKFIIQHVPRAKETLSILYRSTRSISSSLFLWNTFLEISELQNNPLSKIQEQIFEMAPFHLSASLDDMIIFMLSWMNYIRRFYKLPCKDDVDSSLEHFIFWMRKCQDILNIYFPKEQDPTLFPRLAHYGALICSMCDKLDMSRSIYENDILSKKYGYSKYLSTWTHYTRIEQQHGNLEQCRILFKRSMASITDKREEMYKEWIQFENSFSSTIDQVFKTRESIDNVKSENIRSDSRDNQEIESVFLSNLPFKTTNDELRQFVSRSFPVSIKDVRLVFDDHGKSRGFAYVDFLYNSENNQTLDQLLSLDRKLFIQGRPVFISIVEEKELDPYSIYITNIPFEYRQDDIYSLFSQFGSIERVFLMDNRVAFVTFKDPVCAKSSLKLNGYHIVDHDCNINVRIAKRSRDKRHRPDNEKKQEIQFIPSFVDKKINHKRKLSK